MRSLLDVSVLIALFDENHTLHDVSHRWFANNSDGGWASCPITENALIRIMAGDKYKRAQRLSVQDVLEALLGFSRNNHEFWPDDVSINDGRLILARSIHGPGQLTDIYLLALAVKNNGRFVTLDLKIPQMAIPSAAAENLVVLGSS